MVNLVIVVVGTVALRLLRVPTGIDHTRPEDYIADADDAVDRLESLLDDVPQTGGAHALRRLPDLGRPTAAQFGVPSYPRIEPDGNAITLVSDP